MLYSSESKIDPSYFFELLSNGNSTSNTGFNITLQNVTTDIYKSNTISSLIRIYAWTILCVSIIGIIGNLLVLLVYLKKFRDITPFKFLICHLAVCDLLFSFVMVFAVIANGWYKRWMSYTWMFNSLSCKIIMVGTQLSMLVSVGAIFAVTVERFQGIRQGTLSNTRSNVWRKVLAGVCLIWVASVGSGIPIFMLTKLATYRCQNKGYKHLGKGWIKIYSIYLLLFFCLIPMIAIALMNRKICLEIKKPVRSNNLYGHIPENIAALSRRRDMRIVRILIIITVSFFILVLPMRAIFAVLSFFDLESLEITHGLSISLYVARLSYLLLHAAVNPVMYSIIDKNFRKDLANVFVCHERNVSKWYPFTCLISRNSTWTSSKMGVSNRENLHKKGDLHRITINSECSLLANERYEKGDKQKKCFQTEMCV